MAWPIMRQTRPGLLARGRPVLVEAVGHARQGRQDNDAQQELREEQPSDGADECAAHLLVHRDPVVAVDMLGTQDRRCSVDRLARLAQLLGDAVEGPLGIAASLATGLHNSNDTPHLRQGRIRVAQVDPQRIAALAGDVVAGGVVCEVAGEVVRVRQDIRVDAFAEGPGGEGQEYLAGGCQRDEDDGGHEQEHAETTDDTVIAAAAPRPPPLRHPDEAHDDEAAREDEDARQGEAEQRRSARRRCGRVRAVQLRPRLGRVSVEGMDRRGRGDELPPDAGELLLHDDGARRRQCDEAIGDPHCIRRHSNAGALGGARVVCGLAQLGDRHEHAMAADGEEDDHAGEGQEQGEAADPHERLGPGPRVGLEAVADARPHQHRDGDSEAQDERRGGAADAALEEAAPGGARCRAVGGGEVRSDGGGELHPGALQVGLHPRGVAAQRHIAQRS
mmetsp:Transcript_13223/g.38110  ORF Transcript_13223/g.38110 Transcript_13223/m.38110 type:complete len:447 (-) Transcript_13223:88-1428(-)